MLSRVMVDQSASCAAVELAVGKTADTPALSLPDHVLVVRGRSKPQHLDQIFSCDLLLDFYRASSHCPHQVSSDVRTYRVVGKEVHSLIKLANQVPSDLVQSLVDLSELLHYHRRTAPVDGPVCKNLLELDEQLVGRDAPCFQLLRTVLKVQMLQKLKLVDERSLAVHHEAEVLTASRLPGLDRVNTPAVAVIQQPLQAREIVMHVWQHKLLRRHFLLRFF